MFCGPSCLTDRLINSSFTAEVRPSRRCDGSSRPGRHASSIQYVFLHSSQAMGSLDSLMRHMDMMETQMMLDLLRRGPAYLDALVTYEHNGLAFARISKKALVKQWGQDLVFTVLRCILCVCAIPPATTIPPQWWLFLQHPSCVHSRRCALVQRLNHASRAPVS